MITFNTAPERIRIWICFCLLNNPTGWYVSPVQTAGRQTSKGEGERMLPQLWALSLQRTWSLEHHSYLQSLYQGEKPQAATRLNGSLASKSGTKAKGPRWLLHNKIPSNTRRQSPQRPTSESSDSSGPLEYVPVNPPRETFTPAGSSHGPAGVSLKQKGWVLAVKKYNLGSLTCTLFQFGRDSQGSSSNSTNGAGLPELQEHLSAENCACSPPGISAGQARSLHHKLES